MRRRAAALILVLAGTLPSCTRHPAGPPAAAHYVVGDPYQAGGVWYYPREQTAYDATGLATIAPSRTGLTADGETFDDTALAAGHQTLQLPAIAQVTNLENGREVLVRLNDRAPANPARLLALTARAAELLGATEGTRIRVTLDETMTRILAGQLGGGPRVDLAAAPRDSLQAEVLPPPPGAGQSGRGTGALGATPITAAPASGPAVPDRLPEQVFQTSPDPGQIFLRASEFGRIDYAQRLSAQMYGLNPAVETVQDGRERRYRVRAGPFASVAEADAALDQARRAGVVDARLVVE